MRLNLRTCNFPTHLTHLTHTPPHAPPHNPLLTHPHTHTYTPHTTPSSHTHTRTPTHHTLLPTHRQAPGAPRGRSDHRGQFKKQSSFVRPGTVPKSTSHVISWFNKSEAPKGIGRERDGSFSIWFHGKCLVSHTIGTVTEVAV